MTYTPPPPNYYPPQPYQAPLPPEPPKKKGHWLPSTFAAIGVIVVALFLLNLAGLDLGGGGPSSTPSKPSTPALIKADPSDADKSSYEPITDRDYAAIAKNPDGNRGRKIVVYGKVSQADSRTGETMILADMGGEHRLIGYDQNTMVRGSAELLRPVVSGDVVQVWATVLGEYEYESMAKIEWRVPSLQANMLEVLPNP